MIVLNDQGGAVMSVTEDIVATLRAQDHGHPPIVCYAAGFIHRQGSKAHGIGWQEEVAPTLREGMLPDVCIRNLPH